MKNKKQLLSLYIRCDSPEEVEVTPVTERSYSNGVLTCSLDHNPGSQSRISVINHSKCAIQIEQVTLNNIELNNLSQWSRLIVDGKVQPCTHGYIIENGEYKLTVHQNPLIHNYLAYFLSRSQ